MKNFLLGAIAFFLFSISISILQTSCEKKEAFGDTNTTNTTNAKQIGRVYYSYSYPGSETHEIWSMNYDGTDPRKVNVIMPPGYSMFPEGDMPKISPDGKTMFFTGWDTSDPGEPSWIFSANIDGTNVKRLMLIDGRAAKFGRGCLGDAI